MHDLYLLCQMDSDGTRCLPALAAQLAEMDGDTALLHASPRLPPCPLHRGLAQGRLLSACRCLMGKHLLECHSARGHVGQAKMLRRFAAEVPRQHVSQQHAATRDTDHTKSTCIPLFLCPNFSLHPSIALQACLLLSDPALTGTAGPQSSRSDKQVMARGSQT